MMMMKLLLIILLSLSLQRIECVKLRNQDDDGLNLNSFAIEYFQFKGINNLVYIDCKSKSQASAFTLRNGIIENENINYVKDFLDLNFFVMFHKNFSEFHLHRGYRTGILFDLTQCLQQDIKKIFHISDQKNSFTTNNFWFIRASSFQQINNIFKDIFVTPDSDLKILIMKSIDDVQLIDCYKISQNQELKLLTISNQIKSPMDMLKCLRYYGITTVKRKNFENIKILCGVVIEKPEDFINFEDVKTRHINTIAKVSYPIVSNLRHDLNFSFDLFQVDNWGWQHNGSFENGLMGRFQHNQSDMAINALFMRRDRIDVISYMAETFHLRSCLIFRQPPLSAVTNIFILPFALDVWIAILFFIVITIASMTVQILYHPKLKISMTLFDCFTFVWGAICQQSFHIEISTKSIRFLIFTTFISTLFLFTSFSANIVALLQSPSESIKSINDLVHSPLDVAAQDIKYNRIYYKELTDAATKILYTKKIQPKGEHAYIQPDIGMRNVRNNLFAFQVESQAAYQIISDTFDEQEKCGLKELEPFKLPVASIPVKKNFPYQELFRQRLRWQRETGLINREIRKWIPQRPVCENKVGGFVSIGLTESRYPLLWYCIGLSISFFILILEILWKKYEIFKSKL